MQKFLKTIPLRGFFSLKLLKIPLFADLPFPYKFLRLTLCLFAEKYNSYSLIAVLVSDNFIIIIV